MTYGIRGSYVQQSACIKSKVSDQESSYGIVGMATLFGKPNTAGQQGSTQFSQNGGWHQQTATQMIAPISLGSATPFASKHIECGQTADGKFVNSLGKPKIPMPISHQDSLI